MFVHEAKAAMLPVESAVVLIDACAGVEPMTSRVWSYAEEFSLPRILVVNQVDHPKADSRMGRMRMVELLQEKWGRQIVPVQLPIVDQHGFHGVVDLVTMNAFLYKPDGDGHGGPPVAKSGPADGPFHFQWFRLHPILCGNPAGIPSRRRPSYLRQYGTNPFAFRKSERG